MLRDLAYWIVMMLGSGALAGQVLAADEVLFNRDIRPILSNNCFKCHGPDAKERQGGTDGLRLDTSAGANDDLGDGTRAIVPGQTSQSVLVRRITATNPLERMPPQGSGKQLTAREIELLTSWVAQGAVYEKHWSYAHPVRRPLPTVHDRRWPRNAIDYFVLDRLEREGLKPTSEADRFALIRRLSLDLTGLPPSVNEADQFATDASADAVDKLVDRLLEQESFGEHWARMWLDLARYADSAGYADDPSRTIWAFRDYVIRSLNANKPFDQFTLEQIAGDLLPEPTEEQLTATAFHRNTLTNSEGGTNDEEFRNVAVVDRVNTTWATWMGTSMACAQCHHHKYDPISQEEFFQFFAILNNTEDNDRRDEAPLLDFFTSEQSRTRAVLQDEISRLELTIRTPTPELTESLNRWERDFSKRVPWRTPRPSAASAQSGAELTIHDDGYVLVPVRQKTDVYTITLPISGETVTALRLEALPHGSLPNQGPGHGDGGNFIVTRVIASITPPESKPSADSSTQSARPLAFSSAYAETVQEGYDLASVFNPPNAKSAKNAKNTKTTGWAIGSASGQPHALTLVASAPVETLLGSQLTVTIEQLSKQEFHTLGCFRISFSDDRRVAEYADIPASILKIMNSEAAQRTGEQQRLISEFYFGTKAPELKSARDRLASIRKRREEIKSNTVPIARELPPTKHRTTRIQFRGNFLDLGAEVRPAVPAVSHPMPDGSPDRLAMAKWLVDIQNPLTPRVIANRFWEQIFGIGLVRTSEEFGSQGELPSHPELLDWLAVELVESGWNVKRLLKLLVTSAAYRQSSKVSPELVERDPDNRLLGRGPRFRLSAEMVRDQALHVSGLLSSKMYGPSVKPPQPVLGLNAAFGSTIDWKASEGTDRYRRGLYTEWRRSNPYPSMITFDAPNREVCTIRRNLTNTPLQALVTLNDPVYVECAQSLARLVAQFPGTVAEKARHAFRLCLTRPPYDHELGRLLALYQAAHAEFSNAPEQATRMATNPVGPIPSAMDPVELASWTVTANVLLNLDEMLMKR